MLHGTDACKYDWFFESKFRADVTGREPVTVDVAPVGLEVYVMATWR